jgi:hypothetical protein
LGAKTGFLCIFVSLVYISSKHRLPALSLSDFMDHSIKTKDDFCTSPQVPGSTLVGNFLGFLNKLNLARLKSASKAITPSGWLQVNKDG